MTSRVSLSVLACLLLPGCMTVAGYATASSPCSSEQVWKAVASVLPDASPSSGEQAAVVMETPWKEISAAAPAGALQRDVNRERMKYVVDVKPDGTRTIATVVQLREEWSPMGVRMRQWRAVPGNPSEEEALAAAIARRLKDNGC